MTGVAVPGLLVRVRDGRVDCLHAQWGGSDAAIGAVLDGGQPVEAVADWQPAGRKPSLSACLADLDSLRLSAVYLQDGATRVYRPLWFGLPTAGLVAEPTAGVLVRVRSLADARRLRHDWRTLKGLVAEAVTAGRLPLPVVPLVLRAALAGRETLGGPAWLA